MKVLIVAYGQVCSSILLKAAVDEADLVIAADGGAMHLWVVGLKPTQTVGDMDSIKIDISTSPGKTGELITFNADKDQTDLELAFEYVVGLGATEVLMLGVTGGRVDHTLANLSLIVKYPELIKTFAPEGAIRVVTPDCPLSMKLHAGTTVSLSAFNGEANGVKTSGLKYELDDETLEMSGRGVENIAMGGIEIIVTEGNLIVTVHTEDPAFLWGNDAGSGFDFGTIAEQYDNYYKAPLGRIVDRIEKDAMKEVLPDDDGLQLLEIGSGTGHWSEWFAELGFNVTGVDISKEMIKVASGKCSSCRYMVMDGAELMLPDDFFDVVASVAVLEFVKNPSLVISEMVRVAKPGGKLLLGMFNEASYLGRKRYLESDPIFSPANFFTENQIRELLSPHGDVKITQCLFFDVDDKNIDTAMDVEREGRELARTDGNFMIAEVRL